MLLAHTIFLARANTRVWHLVTKCSTFTLHKKRIQTNPGISDL